MLIDYLAATGSLRGFSFHVGCGQTDLHAWTNALEKIESLYAYIQNSFHESVYRNADIIDIGGGFSMDEKSLRIEDIRKSLSPWISKYNDKTWIAEPGRFFTADCLTLLSCIISKNNRLNDRPYYVISNSIHHTFSCILFDLHCPRSLSEEDWRDAECPLERSSAIVDGTIVGETCDGIDVLYNGKVPGHLEIGTVLAFPGMGAYTNASANRFNGFEAPDVVYI